MRRLSPFALMLLLSAAATTSYGAPPTGTTGQPALISADRISQDDELGIIVASGHVEISQGDRIIHADTVTYNQRTDMATASGNVSMLDPAGEVVFANYMELIGGLKDGVAQGFRILLTDQSRFAAAGARRTGGTLIEMRKAVYSPCDLCKEDPERPPLWQIKADLVVHDMTDHEIYYEDALLEMFGIPVAYTPYISAPDPTVKRRSGFLPATYGVSTQTGEMLALPYYWAVSPDIDMTIAPIFTTKAGVVANGEYRERWGDAELEMDASLTQSHRFDEFGNPKPGEEFRGHIVGDAVVNIDENWRAGFDAQRESDPTYLLFYKMLWQPPTILTSDAYVENFFGRSYQSVFAYDFQDLRTMVNNRELPIVLPVWSLEYVTKPGPYGDFWTVETNAYDIARISGPDTRRISTREQWQIPYTSPLGDTTTFTASLQTDGYESYDDVNTNNSQSLRGNQERLSGRILPQAKVEWRWPWVRDDGFVSEVIEPRLAVIVGPQGRNSAIIPNEDSLDFELDEENLYSLNPNPGDDRVDGGDRIVYGSKFGAYGANGGSASLFLGELYSFQRNHSFDPESGLSGNASDYVGLLQIKPQTFVNLSYRFDFDQQSLKPRRTEVNLSGGPPILSGNLGYASDAGFPSVGISSVQQASFGFSSKFAQYWSLTGNALFDLQAEQFRLIQFGVQYADECFTLKASIFHDYIHVANIVPGTTFLVQFIFKNLGDTKFGGSFGGSTVPSSARAAE